MHGHIDGEKFVLHAGEIILKKIGKGAAVKAELCPKRGLDIGFGSGKSGEAEIKGGVVGIILDGRGRNPFVLPADKYERIKKLKQWQAVLGG